MYCLYINCIYNYLIETWLVFFSFFKPVFGFILYLKEWFWWQKTRKVNLLLLRLRLNLKMEVWCVSEKKTSSVSGFEQGERGSLKNKIVSSFWTRINLFQKQFGRDLSLEFEMTDVFWNTLNITFNSYFSLNIFL